MNGLLIGVGVVSAVAIAMVGGQRAFQLRIRRLRDDHSLRAQLWDRFYAHNWGDTTTNNYGFAPASPDDSSDERFQRQMYRELLLLLQQSGRQFPAGARLVEVSCGRGGGLSAFLDASGEDSFEAVGLDVAKSAVNFCRCTHAGRPGLSFVEGSAMDLPFPDNSVDVLLNVEASNDYPDRERFFSEVARVLKPGGIFLYADTEKAKHQGRMAQDLAAAGFHFDLREITANVVDACREDSPRRRAVIAKHAPLAARMLLNRELCNYTAVEGSRKFAAFASGKRRYFMTAAISA